MGNHIFNCRIELQIYFDSVDIESLAIISDKFANIGKQTGKRKFCS